MISNVSHKRTSPPRPSTPRGLGRALLGAAVSTLVLGALLGADVAATAATLPEAPRRSIEPTIPGPADTTVEDLAASPISILSPIDGATVQPPFTVTGTGEYLSFIRISHAGDPVGSVFIVDDPDGSWSVTILPVFEPGPETLTFTQESDGSVATLSIIVQAPPVITPVAITAPAADSTVGLRPALTGAGTPDAIVTITDGATSLGTTTVDTTGAWSFLPAADLALGPHTFTATQDVDSSTATVSVTVAATVPTPSPSPSPTPGPGSGAGELPSTGADAAPLLLIGGLFAATGIAATVLGRRERTHTSSGERGGHRNTMNPSEANAPMGSSVFGGERSALGLSGQLLSSGSPGGFTSDSLTASSCRPQASSSWSYWPFSIR